MALEKEGESKRMDYESLIYDFASSCKRKDFEKAVYFCDALDVFYCIAKLKYKDGVDEHFRHLLSGYLIYYDSGTNFAELRRNMRNILDSSSMTIVEDEYVLYDDAQEKRVYIDRRSFNGDTVYSIIERIKGEF